MSARRHVLAAGLALLTTAGLMAGCGGSGAPEPAGAEPPVADTATPGTGDKAAEDAGDSVDPNEVCPKIPYSVIDTVGAKPATSLQAPLAGEQRGVKCAYISADGGLQAEVTYRPDAGADALATRQDQVRQLKYTVEPVAQLGPGAFTYTGSHGRRAVAAIDEGRKLIDVNVWNTTPAKAFEFWQAVADLL